VAVQYVKVYAWSLTEYKRVMYLDADAVVTRNLLPYFTTLDAGTTWFANGQMELVQGSWFLGQPDKETFEDLHKLVYDWRFDRGSGYAVGGWLGDPTQRCIDDDQGLFECYFRYRHAGGAAVAVYDRKLAMSKFLTLQAFRQGEPRRSTDLRGGFEPVKNKAYEHFGGQHKAWAKDKGGTAMCDVTPAALAQRERSFRYPWSSAKRAAFRSFCADVRAYSGLEVLFRHHVLSKTASEADRPLCDGKRTVAPNRTAAQVLHDVQSCRAP